MFNYNHLYYFYVTAREGGVIKAASVLRISQPSLSAQLKALERELGKSLLVKVGRKLELTDEGRTTYALCKQMFEVAGELSRALHTHPGSDRTRLNVAVSDEVERPFAAAYLSSLFGSMDTSGFSIRMMSGRHGTMLEELDKNRSDLLLTNYSADEREFQTIASVKMPVHCFVSAPFLERVGLEANAKKLEAMTSKNLVDALAKTRPNMVAPTPDQKLRQEIHHFLEQNSISLPVAFESNALTAVLRSATEGLGVTFVPATYVVREQKSKQLLRWGSKPLWTHGLNLICKPQLTRDPVVKHAKSAFEEMTQDA